MSISGILLATSAFALLIPAAGIFDMIKGFKRCPSCRRIGVAIHRDTEEVDRQIGVRHEEAAPADVSDVLRDVLDGYSYRTERGPRDLPYAYVTYKEYYQCRVCQHTWEDIFTRNVNGGHSKY